MSLAAATRTAQACRPPVDGSSQCLPLRRWKWDVLQAVATLCGCKARAPPSAASCVRPPLVRPSSGSPPPHPLLAAALPGPQATSQTRWRCWRRRCACLLPSLDGCSTRPATTVRRAACNRRTCAWLPAPAAPAPGPAGWAAPQCRGQLLAGVCRRRAQQAGSYACLAAAAAAAHHLPGSPCLHADLWVRRDERGRYTSLQKLELLKGLCSRLGVHTQPGCVGLGVWIVPLLSWYHASWDRRVPSPCRAPLPPVGCQLLVVRPARAGCGSCPGCSAAPQRVQQACRPAWRGVLTPLTPLVPAPPPSPCREPDVPGAAKISNVRWLAGCWGHAGGALQCSPALAQARLSCQRSCVRVFLTLCLPFFLLCRR